MQTSNDRMSIMARELCTALGIDIPLLYDSLYDQDSSPTSAYSTSDIVAEVDRSDE
jgi:hypothetical protein